MPKQKRTNFVLSITSGLFAAGSTLFAKLLSSSFSNEPLSFLPSSLDWISPKLILLPLVIGCNVLMWSTFTRALSSSPSSAAVSVLNNSANMIASALMGFIIFQEELSVRWWVGAGFVLAGTALMTQGDTQQQTPKKHAMKTRSKKTE
ncbi:hypothetical protein BCR33DRAFT_851772 [Rhizoclosmatium globosum]|uniref:EamA domain-containing protein n=1 Tax=Rhizoclosmatium globosum TaxID=329046 RepID=A0A1Y2C5E7_9FUNG|nr:hypothetical protein BCR33DRAFT_851772 [Rhizoclosmatium globosum]|eukprot:ORY42251.1 hypothetical protein BCR33DRAFT_851772 [Rhizoclosmatium globosum]